MVDDLGNILLAYNERPDQKKYERLKFQVDDYLVGLSTRIKTGTMKIGRDYSFRLIGDDGKNYSLWGFKDAVEAWGEARSLKILHVRSWVVSYPIIYVYPSVSYYRLCEKHWWNKVRGNLFDLKPNYNLIISPSKFV